MEKKTKHITILKVIIFAVLVVMATGTAFGQAFDLALTSSDLRLEPVYSNDMLIGYNLFVRKKPGIESVMLTEPSGYHALRSTEWNSINGYERRELSGVPLSDTNSRYSIVSSTPIYDMHFGSAFQLFIPPRVMYGNPSSSAGTVFLPIGNGIQINIRTFDHKYADPNAGRFQNNLAWLDTAVDYYSDNEPISPVADQSPAPVQHYERPVPPPPASGQSHKPPPSPKRDLTALKKELRLIIDNKEILDRMGDEELVKFLKETFKEKGNE